MASLGDVYRQVLQEHYGFPPGWLANWPASFDKRVGKVGWVADCSFGPAGELGDYGIAVDTSTELGTKSGPWDYTYGKSTHFDIGANASTPGWEWIGNAKAGLKVGFGNETGFVVSIGSTQLESMIHIDGLRDAILEAARAGRLQEGHAVIVEQQLAANGLEIVSSGHSGELSATTNVDVGPPGTKDLFAFAADFHLTSKSQSVDRKSFPNGFTVAFRVVKLGKKGFFWWRDWDVTRALGDGDEESDLDDSDYFALL